MKKLLWFPMAAGMAIIAINHPVRAQAPADSAGMPPSVPSEELPAGSEVLTRGPVHEAFAKPVTTDPQAPLVISKQPPEPLQEMPPAEKPAGANIVWVQGYWAWDEDRNDFIWISGCWRNAPPNTYWVPGHWLQLESGWEWITGFWKPVAAQPQQEIEYLPSPPAAIEVAPAGTPPSPELIWVPGCWYWEQGRYVARRGYWLPPHLGWVWVPSHYVWTPRGCIFCPGHWDYDLDNRGVLFTPVYFPPPVRVQVGFWFHPGICVDVGMLRLNLFVVPRYNHYCFGDYYDASYQRAGIYPWYRCQTVHTWYDPLFVYDRWHFGHTDRDWARRQEQDFKARQHDLDLRPARTYAALQVQTTRLPAAKRPARALAEPLKVYATSQSTPVKFERINTNEREQIAARSKDVGSFRNQREQWESPVRRPASSAPTVPQHEPRSEPKPAPTAVPTRPPAVGTKSKAPPRHTEVPEHTPAPPVRVTHPEREVISNPPVQPKPAESRYIEKTSPGHPAPENYRPGAPATPKSSAPPGKNQKEQRGKEQ
jgi:hypothetical protein